MTESQVMPTPRRVDIALTGRCNLACQYCFYADEMVARHDLPTRSWLSFFEELGRSKVMTVCLTGGEVLTRPDLFELIDGLIANRMRYQILSNGTLLTEKVLAQFDVGKRRRRLDSIQVSVDGSRAEIHDRSRPHSFRQVMRGLRLLLEARFPVTVRVTVNRYNVDDLEAIAHLLLDEMGLPAFSTNEAYACGATNRSEAEIMLNRVQRDQAMRTLLGLTRRYNGRIDAQAGPLALARELDRIEAELKAGRTGQPGRGRLCGCGGVFSKIAVLHDGTIVPCHNLSTLRLGMVGVDDLQEIWLNHPLMNALRQRGVIPLQSLATCRDCPYQGFCTGGCPGGAVFLTGEMNARNPADCYRIYKGEELYYPLESTQGEASETSLVTNG